MSGMHSGMLPVIHSPSSLPSCPSFALLDSRFWVNVSFVEHCPRGSLRVCFRTFVLLVYDLIIALESFRLLPAKAFSVSKKAHPDVYSLTCDTFLFELSSDYGQSLGCAPTALDVVTGYTVLLTLYLMDESFPRELYGTLSSTKIIFSSVRIDRNFQF